MSRARDLRPDLYFSTHFVEEGGLTQEFFCTLAKELAVNDAAMETLFNISMHVGKCPHLRLSNVRCYFELLEMSKEERAKIYHIAGCATLMEPTFFGGNLGSDPVVGTLQKAFDVNSFLQQAEQPAVLLDEVQAYVNSLEPQVKEDLLYVPLAFVPKEDGDDASMKWISIQPAYDPEKEREVIDNKQKERIRLGRERRPHPIKGRPEKSSDSMPRPTLWMRIRQLIIWIGLGLSLAILLRALGCQQTFFGG